MSPTIQLETWKTFDPMTTAQTREKASSPIASRRSCPSGILANRWRVVPSASARPVPAMTIAGIVTWLKRKRLLKVAAIASDRNAPKRPGAEPARRSRQADRRRAEPGEAQEPDEDAVLGEEAQPFVVGRVQDRVAELHGQLAVRPVALPEQRLVEEHPPGRGPGAEPLLVAGDQDLPGLHGCCRSRAPGRAARGTTARARRRRRCRPTSRTIPSFRPIRQPTMTATAYSTMNTARL